MPVEFFWTLPQKAPTFFWGGGGEFHLSKRCRRKASLTHAGFEKLAADSLVHANGGGDLFHVGPGGLAQRADTVDAADSLRQECVGCLRTPELFEGDTKTVKKQQLLSRF